MRISIRNGALAVALVGMLAGAASANEADEARLDTVLAAQPEAAKARYQWRHPKETLQFFGIKPGMTVADTLPGAYYSSILLPYLGDSGALVGVSYSLTHRKIDYKDDETRLERNRTWPARFVAMADQWRGNSKAGVSAYLFGGFPASVDGTVDAFLMVRASHHLHKYEDRAQTLSSALADVMRALKPGGTLGIVQHRAPASKSDEWAQGFKGYLKQDLMIKAVEAAGFEFVEASEVNANPKDQPAENDFVWRLPPSKTDGSNDHIGESDRMTLKFRKPM